MRFLRDKFKFIIYSFIFGLCMGVFLKGVYEYSAKQPSNWKHKPIIINCIGPELKEETIQRAIDFWSKNGEHVLFYEYDADNSICNRTTRLDGFILLKKDDGFIKEDNVLASTKRYTSYITTIVASEIYFKEGTYNFILLLEHELGHAFGYNHKKIPGYIMHPYYDLMGRKF